MSSGFRGEVQNVSANQRPGRPSYFSDRHENTKSVEDVEILFSAKFRWILFSGFRGQVANILASQKPGRPSCFSNPPIKHKLGRGRWDLASCKVSLNSVQQFQRSWKCLSQSETQTAILFFQSAQKTQTWGRWDLASCKVSLNSVQRFQRRSLICPVGDELSQKWNYRLASLDLHS